MAKLRTELCDILGIEHPICLAGMGSKGRATPPKLVAAVSEAGGLGVIGGSGMNPEKLREVIREVRTMTSKPIGVNLIMPSRKFKPGKTRAELRQEITQRFPEHVAFVAKLREELGLLESQIPDDVVLTELATPDSSTVGARGDFQDTLQEQLDVLFAEDVQVIAPALGDASSVMARAHDNGVKVMALAGSVKQGKRHAAAGADIVVAQGAEAGGHVGKVGNFALVPGMIDAVSPVPVVAAGSVVDGRGLAAALSLGAVGAWVGTAFLVSEECEIPDAHKSQIISGEADEFQPSLYISGTPIRAFSNQVTAAWASSGLGPLPTPYQKVLMDDLNEAAEAAERFDIHSNPAGQGAGIIRAIRPARQIVEDMAAEAAEILGRLGRLAQ